MFLFYFLFEPHRGKNLLQAVQQSTHRLHQTVGAALVDKALVGGRHPDAGEGPALAAGVPAWTWTGACREAGGGVAPQRLAGAAGFVHQDHGGVDELAPAPRVVYHPRGGGGAGGCRVGPGGGRHGGNAAGSRVQAVLVLTQEARAGYSRVIPILLLVCSSFFTDT